MKFRTGKFLRDRDESKKRSQNGELDLLKYKDGRSDLKEIMTKSELLNKKLDIHSYVTEKKVIGFGRRKDVSIFINYIKNYKIDCYAYKFPKELML